MIDRRARNIGLRLIEAELSKVAAPEIFNPTLGSLLGTKTRELNSNSTPATASAVVPKVVSSPI